MNPVDPSTVKIVFMGTPEFSASSLKALHEAGYNIVLSVTQPDKPVGRKHIITPSPVKVLSMELGIPVYQPSTFKTEGAEDEIRNMEPDLIVTAAYGKILPQKVLDIPSLGSVNVHGSSRNSRNREIMAQYRWRILDIICFY